MDWSTKKERSEKSMKLDRIDKILSMINLFRLKPLGYDSNTGEYNYKLWLRELTTLSNEVTSEFDKKEKEADEKFRTDIKKTLIVYPIHKQGYEDSFYGKKNTIKFNYLNWDKLETILEDYERFLRNSVTNYFKGFSYTDEDTSGTVIEGGDDDSS